MLKIIISPAKKMNIMEEAPAEAGTPRFLEQAERLKAYLQSLDYNTLKEIWKCNEKLADLNFGRLQDMNLKRQVTPAVFAYEGIQYQSMAPMVFEQKHLDYIENHLYILSGFYGLLRAFDGVVPYRLEMQARIQMEEDGNMYTSLYEYWGRRLYDSLTEDMQPGQDSVIINLASKEYAKAVRPWAAEGIRMVDCVFGEWDKRAGTAEENKVRVKATAAKMARGAMVRFMAENQVEKAEELKEFSWMGYRYQKELSGEDTLVFVQQPGGELPHNLSEQ